ncbi:MAG: DUF2330 domain-containing protein [Planctomycetes bacterium]|nr:DUF2330 domain-containing protein [Planctomycetota bacterium]
MKKILLILLLVICLPLIASADGKFYAREKVPPDVPYQRAIISYQDGTEIMILQSKFAGQAEDFGWVVPLPNPPKFGSVKKDDAESFFWQLSHTTSPKVIYISQLIITITLLIMIIIFIILAVEKISCAIRRKPVPKLFQFSVNHPIWIIPIILFIASIATPNLLSSRGVDLLHQEQVGIYDVKVIKASNASDLINWLNEHKYKFTPQDETTFNNYVQKGWCFITARINPKESITNNFRSRDGLVNPLVMEFLSKNTVYPLSLTATVGSNTEILLYIFGNHKTDADNRFELEFAKETNYSLNELKLESKEIDMAKYPGKYLTKLRGKLSSEQMKEDLVLKQAKDDKTYRKTIWH